MNSDELGQAATIRHIERDPDLATTLIKAPRETILPKAALAKAGEAALDALKAHSASPSLRFELHKTLGEGGMGVVHLGTQVAIGRHVAVKTLRAGKGDLDATLRILREAWVTGSLEHPNVVPVYDVGVDASGAPMIVMKRIEGREWAGLIHAPAEIALRFSAFDPLEWNLRILLAACRAVHFAHDKGILHRDLKPENVMVGAFGEVYVLDWGIAVSLRDDPSGRLPLAADVTEVAGTPCYMAPEMLNASGEDLSPRTDVYLLGAILYEIFAGKPPHEGATLQAMVASIVLSNPAYPEGFPAEVKGICERAMAREPKDRYGSADALRAAIEGYLEHRGSNKLAWGARQSLARLTEVIKNEPAGEDRTLAVFNLLGECRFGFRAALAAWPGNEAARRGLDAALVAVIEHELGEGDASAAASLLREVKAPPGDLPARVEAANKARLEQEERLRKLERDYDPKVGTRTRTFLGTIFGVLWTMMPLLAWLAEVRGYPTTHLSATLTSLGFLALGLVAFVWARETMTKTQLNLKLAKTLGYHLGLQAILGAGAWISGLTIAQSQTLYVFSWALSLTLLSIWVERRFAISAAVATTAFLVIAWQPWLLYGAMAVNNVVFTFVLVRVWFPPDDLVKIRARREELRRRARRFLEDVDQRTRIGGGGD